MASNADQILLQIQAQVAGGADVKALSGLVNQLASDLKATGQASDAQRQKLIAARDSLQALAGGYAAGSAEARKLTQAAASLTAQIGRIDSGNIRALAGYLAGVDTNAAGAKTRLEGIVTAAQAASSKFAAGSVEAQKLAQIIADAQRSINQINGRGIEDLEKKLKGAGTAGAQSRTQLEAVRAAALLMAQGFAAGSVEAQRLAAIIAGADAGLKRLTDAEKSTGLAAQIAARALAMLRGEADSSAGGFSRLQASLVSVNAGFSLLQQVTQGVQRIIGSGLGLIRLAGDMEQAQTAFTTMLGSGQKAQAFLADLADFAAHTPFELVGLRDSSRRLLAYGFQAKDIIPVLTAVGNAVGSLGGGKDMLDGVTLAIGQIYAKGKVQAQEMNQLAERGIPAWKMLADKIGVSIPEAMKMAENGSISAATALPVILEGLQKRFGGGMEAQSKTLLGMWSNTTDVLKQLGGEAGTYITEKLGLKDLLAQVNANLGKVKSLFESGGIDGLFKSLSQRISQVLFAPFTEQGKSAEAALSKTRSAINSAWASIRSTYDSVLVPVFERYAPLVKRVWTEVPGVIQGAARFIEGAFNLIAALWEHVLKPVWDALAPALGAAVTAIYRILAGWLDRFGSTFQAISQLINGDYQGAANTFSEMWARTGKSIDDALEKVWSALKTLGMNAFNKAKQIGLNIRDGIVAGTADLAAKLGESVSNAIEKVKGYIPDWAWDLLHIGKGNFVDDTVARAKSVAVGAREDKAERNAPTYGPSQSDMPQHRPQTVQGREQLVSLLGLGGARTGTPFGGTYFGNQIHNGEDLFAKTGQDVLAPFTGYLTTRWSKTTGHIAELIDAEGNKLLLGHLNKYADGLEEAIKKAGGKLLVQQGQLIAEVGQTGSLAHADLGPGNAHIHAMGFRAGSKTAVEPFDIRYVGVTTSASAPLASRVAVPVSKAKPESFDYTGVGGAAPVVGLSDALSARLKQAETTFDLVDKNSAEYQKAVDRYLATLSNVQRLAYDAAMKLPEADAGRADLAGIVKGTRDKITSLGKTGGAVEALKKQIDDAKAVFQLYTKETPGYDKALDAYLAVLRKAATESQKLAGSLPAGDKKSALSSLFSSTQGEIDSLSKKDGLADQFKRQLEDARAAFQLVSEDAPGYEKAVQTYIAALGRVQAAAKKAIPGTKDREQKNALSDLVASTRSEVDGLRAAGTDADKIAEIVRQKSEQRAQADVTTAKQSVSVAQRAYDDGLKLAGDNATKKLEVVKKEGAALQAAREQQAQRDYQLAKVQADNSLKAALDAAAKGKPALRAAAEQLAQAQHTGALNVAEDARSNALLDARDSQALREGQDAVTVSIQRSRTEYSALAATLRDKISTGKVDAQTLQTTLEKMDALDASTKKAGTSSSVYVAGAKANVAALYQQAIDSQIASGAYDGLSDSFDRASKAQGKVVVSIAEAVAQMPQGTAATAEYLTALEALEKAGYAAGGSVQDVRDAIYQNGIDADIASGKYDNLTDGFDRAKKAQDAIVVSVQDAVDQIPSGDKTVAAYIKTLSELEKQGYASAGSLRAVTDEIKRQKNLEAQDTIDAEVSSGTYSAVSDGARQADGAIKPFEKLTYTTAELLAQMPDTLKGLDDFEGGLELLATNGSITAKQLDALKAAIQGVRDAAGPIAGLKGDQFEGRGLAINVAPDVKTDAAYGAVADENKDALQAGLAGAAADFLASALKGLTKKGGGKSVFADMIRAELASRTDVDNLVADIKDNPADYQDGGRGKSKPSEDPRSSEIDFAGLMEGIKKQRLSDAEVLKLLADPASGFTPEQVAEAKALLITSHQDLLDTQRAQTAAHLEIQKQMGLVSESDYISQKAALDKEAAEAAFTRATANLGETDKAYVLAATTRTQQLKAIDEKAAADQLLLTRTNTRAREDAITALSTAQEEARYKAGAVSEQDHLTASLTARRLAAQRAYGRALTDANGNADKVAAAELALQTTLTQIDSDGAEAQITIVDKAAAAKVKAAQRDVSQGQGYSFSANRELQAALTEQISQYRADLVGGALDNDKYRATVEALQAAEDALLAARGEQINIFGRYADLLANVIGALGNLAGAMGQSEQAYDRFGKKLNTPWTDLAANIKGAETAFQKVNSMAGDVAKIVASGGKDIGSWVALTVKLVSGIGDAIAGFKKAHTEVAKLKADFADQNPLLNPADYQKTSIRSRGVFADIFGGGPEVVNEIDKLGLKAGQSISTGVYNGLDGAFKKYRETGNMADFEKTLTSSVYESAAQGLVDAFKNSSGRLAEWGGAIKAYSDALALRDDDPTKVERITAAIAGLGMAAKNTAASAKQTAQILDAADRAAGTGRYSPEAIAARQRDLQTRTLNNIQTALAIQNRAGLLSDAEYQAQKRDAALATSDVERQGALAAANLTAQDRLEIDERFDLQRRGIQQDYLDWEKGEVKKAAEIERGIRLQALSNRDSLADAEHAVALAAADTDDQRRQIDAAYNADRLARTLERISLEEEAELSAADLTAAQIASIHDKYATQRTVTQEQAQAAEMQAVRDLAKAASDAAEQTRVSWRQSLLSGVQALLSGNSPLDAMYKGVRDRIGQAIQDGFIVKRILSQLDPLFTQLDAALSKGLDAGGLIQQIGAALPGLSVQLGSELGPLLGLLNSAIPDLTKAVNGNTAAVKEIQYTQTTVYESGQRGGLDSGLRARFARFA